MFEPSSFLSQIIHGVLLLLAVVNPVGNIPIYVNLTQHMEPHARVRVFNLGVVAAFSMVILFALLGDWSLRNIFEVTLDEFRIAGGILLFIIAARGVLGAASHHKVHPDDEHAMAIFPLSFPIIVGPGSLALTIILSLRYGAGKMVLISLIAMGVTYLIVRTSHALMRILGPYAGQIIARLLYLFLAAKAVSLVLTGFATYWRTNVL